MSLLPLVVGVNLNYATHSSATARALSIGFTPRIICLQLMNRQTVFRYYHRVVSKPEEGKKDGDLLLLTVKGITNILVSFSAPGSSFNCLWQSSRRQCTL